MKQRSSRKAPFTPDAATVANYVDNPNIIGWEQRCYLEEPFLGGYEHTLRDARGRYAYIADNARVLGYPSIIDQACQMAAVVRILETRGAA